jgi:WD40 repeat protein
MMDETMPTAPVSRQQRPSERVDEACDRFEAAWRAGRAPRIEDYLAEAEAADRPALRVELIALERELRQLTQTGARSDTAARISSAADVPTIAPESGSCLPPQNAASASVHDEVTLTPTNIPAEPLISDTGRLLVTDTPTARIQSPFDDTVSPDELPSGPACAPSPARIRYFGDYEILSEIARGGMGVVFRARQVSLNRPVALKMILAGQLANETEVRRFYTEAEAAANLDHPGIVPIHEVGQHEGQHYFSMGFVEGQSLSQRLANGPLRARDAAALLAKVADAIEYAHRRGIIHRDLKPANILIDADGNPRVTDFGLAKKVQADSALTGSGQIMGTPSYMPPEQAGGERGEVGPAADVYALGATLYALVTGRPPFQAATAMDTVLQVISDEPVPPRRLNVSVPVDLETICLKCLQKEPGKRYASTADLAADLRRFLADEPIVARPITRVERAAKWVRRRPTIAALWAAIAVLAAAGLGGVLWQWRAAVQARVVADASAREAKDQENRAILARNEAKDKEKEAITARNEAKNQEKMALLARDDAEQSRRKEALALAASEQARGALKEEKDRALANLYATSVALAHEEWFNANVRRALELLSGCKPAMRNWEWHYLNGLCHSELVAEPGFSMPTVVAFAGDGKTIVSVDAGGTFKRWDPATGRGQRFGSANVMPLVFDRARLRLAGVNPKQPGPIQVWDLESPGPPRLLKQLDQVDGLVPVGEFSPDGKVLAIGTHSGKVHFWDIDRDVEARKPLVGNNEQVTALAYSPDGRILSVGKENGWVEIWDTETGLRRHVFRGHPSRDAQVKQLAFSPDVKRLATVGVDGTAKIWAIDDGRRLVTLWGHRGFLLGVAFSPDGRFVATAGYDHTARLWDAETGQNLEIYRGHDSIVYQVAFSPDSRRLVTASYDTTFRLWEIDAAQPAHPDPASSASAASNREPTQRTISGRTAAVAALAFHPTAPRLASVDWDGLLRIDDLQTRRPVLSTTFPPVEKKSTGTDTAGQDRSLGAVAYSPDGKRLAVGTGGVIAAVKGIVYVIDAETGVALCHTEALAGPISALAFSPDGRRLLVATGNLRGLRGTAPTVGVFDAATGAQLASYKEHTAAVLDAALNRDGSLAATTGLDGAIRIWGSSDGKKRRHLGEDSGFRGLAWSPDGTLLAAGGILDSSVRIYRTRDGAQLKRLRGHSGEVYRVAFSPDGKRLASAASELKIWDVDTGLELLTQRHHSGEIYDVEFSPDGRWLATAGFDGTIVVRSGVPTVERSTESWPVIFQDRFDRAQLGDQWRQVSGRWSIENGAARGLLVPRGANEPNYLVGSLEPANLLLPSTAEVRFECWSPKPVHVLASLYGRMVAQSGVRFFFVGSRSFGDSQDVATAIYYSVNGQFAPIATNPRSTMQPDTHHRCRLVRERRRLTAFIDDEEVVTAYLPEMDVPFFNLDIGSLAGADSVYFDNLEIRAPAETKSERAALARVAELAQANRLKDEAIEQLRNDPKLDDRARPLALEIASRLDQDPGELGKQGWLVVRDPGRSVADYERALRRLEEAHRLAPTNAMKGGILDSIGVAQLRLGRDRESLESLTRADTILRAEMKTSWPGNLAFQAIAQARLGRRAEAEVLLDRTGDLLGRGVGQERAEELRRIRDEAQATVKSTAATDREATIRNLQAVGKAIQEYAQDKKVLPPASIDSADGKPLLSWRVALLPYLGEKDLFNQFHLNEAWDSPHNRALADKMPACYKANGAGAAGSGITYVRAFVGPGTAFDGRDGLAVNKITDGTVSTVIAAEAAESVPWTKPADLDFTPNGPSPALGSLSTGRASLLFADGAFVTVDRNRLKPEQLRALITRAGGEVVDRSTLAP